MNGLQAPGTENLRLARKPPVHIIGGKLAQLPRAKCRYHVTRLPPEGLTKCYDRRTHRSPVGHQNPKPRIRSRRDWLAIQVPGGG